MAERRGYVCDRCEVYALEEDTGEWAEVRVRRSVTHGEYPLPRRASESCTVTAELHLCGACYAWLENAAELRFGGLGSAGQEVIR